MLYQFSQLWKAALLQARKYLFAVNEYGEFTFLRTCFDFNRCITQFCAQICGETRRSGLMSSGGTVNYFYFHAAFSFELRVKLCSGCVAGVRGYTLDFMLRQ